MVACDILIFGLESKAIEVIGQKLCLIYTKKKLFLDSTPVSRLGKLENDEILRT